MTNEDRKDGIKNRIEKLTMEFGGFENIVVTEQANHACQPHRPNGWDASAIRIDGNLVEIGTVRWDFEDDLEDASDYDWEFGQSDFCSDEILDMDDEDDLDDLETRI